MAEPDEESKDGDRKHGTQGWLTGQFLIAMPGMPDPRFQRSVIYVCAHNDEGAMGLVINRPIGEITFPELLEQLEIKAVAGLPDRPVLSGGPVETGRGFVLHSADITLSETMQVEPGVALTGTLDMLRALAAGDGPRRALFALGYAGWGAGQLDAEIQANGWLTAPGDQDILFDPDLAGKWDRVMDRLGIDPLLLSGEAGHA